MARDAVFRSWHNPRAIFLVGWAGLRGSVTLAAALSLPFVQADGTSFPARDLIVFLAASTIVRRRSTTERRGMRRKS